MAAPAAQPLDPTAFAQDEATADARYQLWRSRDPFPEIQASLLNTADLLDYIRVTGMISPFEPDPLRPDEMLKPASCAIPLGGEYLYWEDARDPIYGGKRTKARQGVIRPGDDLVVHRNSIVYAGLAPTFRIPDYIAARFNLTIKNIYRGILVGTGPLVDPGFDGHLFVPLHNLTSNDYRLVGGEPLVWMEFTKLSPNELWDPDYVRARSRTGELRSGTYVGFPPRKHARQKLRDYTDRAAEGPIRSSIPVLVGRAIEAAETAAREARSLSTRFSTFSFLGLILLVIALAGIFWQTIGLIQDSGQRTDDLTARVDELQSDLVALTEREKALQEQIQTLELRLQAQRGR